MTSPALAQIPGTFFKGGINPFAETTDEQQGVRAVDGRVVYGKKIEWAPRSSYCGKPPPQHLNDEEVLQWFKQKLTKPPCDGSLPEEENLLRFREFKAMMMLYNALKYRSPKNIRFVIRMPGVKRRA